MMKNYEVIENYRDDNKYRDQLFELTDIVFPRYDFRKWFNLGYWPDEYIPFSIELDGKIVSNVSITKMNTYLNGNHIKAIQFGTVATNPDYRKRNLSRYLMEYVIDKYEKDTDLMFLFANDSVTEFYPKFGFIRKHESVFKITSDIPSPAYNSRKLNIDDTIDRELIVEMIKNRCVTTKLFGAENFGSITMWHLLNVFPNDIYYLEDENAIVLAYESDNELHVHDIISTEIKELNSLLPKVIKNENLNSIHIYFSPDEMNYKYDSAYITDDSPFFVRGKFLEDTIKFKFPSTAQT
jgi:GNAT superfamily N-acetyltransferase